MSRRSISAISLALILLFGYAVPALAITWSQIISDTFTRANTSVGSAGTTTGAGNSWTDVIGSKYSIISNTLSLATGQTYGSVLTRPASENNTDPSSRIVLTTTGIPDTSSSTQYAAIFRYQSGGTYYLIFFTANGAIQMYAIIANAVNGLTVSQTTACTTTLGHTYKMDADVQGTSPTALEIQVTDTTTSSVCGSLATASDTRAGLQAATGALGLSGVTNGASIAYSGATTYTPGSPTLVLGDITRTAAAVVTASGSISLTAAAATSGTSPYTYQWYRGTSPTMPQDGTTILTGKTALSLTDSTATNGVTYYYEIKDTDSTAIPQTIVSAPIGAFAPNAIYTICHIGDSITLGIGTSAVTVPQSEIGIIASSIPFVTVNSVNRGVSGLASGDWVSGGSYLPAAVTACKAAGSTQYSIMLGTNDSRLSISASTFVSNMDNITAYINAQDIGKPIILNEAPYADYLRFGTPYTINTNVFLASYAAVYGTITGSNVHVGDTSAFTYFAGANDYNLLADGIHPNDQGAALLGGLWARAFLIATGLAPTGNSGPHSHRIFGR